MASLRNQFLRRTNFHSAWEKVASNKGCAGVDGETIGGFGARQKTHLSQLRQAVAEGAYRPLPWRQIFIPKQKGGWRELRVPTVRDRIVQQAMLNVLHPVMEQEFAPCSFAYRPGRSHLMAVRQVARWRDKGYDWVLDADIVQYFDNLEHQRLLAEVAERLDAPRFLDLIEEWISVGVLAKEGLILPQRGIPQGAVISPILANIYLDDFDEIMSASGLKLVRYADDFVLLSRSEGRLVQAHAEVAQVLSAMGLLLHQDKTQITNFERGFRFLGHAFTGDLIVPIKTQEPRQPVTVDNGLRLVHAERATQPNALQLAMVEALKEAQKPIPPPLFVVLGYEVRQKQTVPITSVEQAWVPGMATIYLVEQGTTIRKQQGRFVVQVPKEDNLEVLIRDVERILVFGNIQLTTSVISVCLAEQIPVVFLTQLGEYKGHLWSAEADSLVVETAQFERRRDEGFRVAVARQIVQGKLWNSKQLLLRLNRKRRYPEVAEVITAISENRKAVVDPQKAATVEQVRGYEGVGAARYFPAMGRLITNPGFSFTERSHRPPKDPMNSLLGFGYSLLYENVLSLLLAEGLNPYLGNLHGAERRKAYLAFDLMEEFRSPVVDTLVMKLVNQKILKPTDFKWPTGEGGIYLTKTARRVYLKHFEERMCLRISHPDIQSKVSYRRVIQLQIQRYRRALLGDSSYEPFLRIS